MGGVRDDFINRKSNDASSDVSTIIIPEIAEKSNPSGEKTSENSSGRDFALDVDSETGGISGAAKKYYRTYKKLFDEFSARNAQNNANENSEFGIRNSELEANSKNTNDNSADNTLLSTKIAENSQKTPLTNINQGNMNVSGREYAFAGENARTTDKMKLATAEQMLKDGADSETIRKETGWFKGYDGKWKFEVDDSNMNITKKHLLLTDGKYTLGEIISHDALLEAYPELADMNIEVKLGGNGIKGSVGAYNAETNTITLNRAIFLPDSDIKKVLIHELQHRIQRIEGFARGSSPEYWREKGIPEGDYNRFVQQTEMEFNREIRKLSEEDAKKVRTYFRLSGRLDELLGKVDFSDDATTQKTLDEASKIEKQHDELYNYLYYQDWFARINDLYNQTELSDNLHTVFYKNTAGEIEARDAAERINLSAEQRKNTRPGIDRTDVVFAGDSQVSYFAKGEYDAETAGIKDQIRNSQEQLNSMDIVFDGTSPIKFDSKASAKTWALSELKKYGFSVDKKGLGIVEFPKNDIYAAIEHLTSFEEIGAIIAVPRVLKRGIQIGEHGDHKTRGKHTITFAAPIKLNGIRGNMAVVVNLRNNKYYIHRLILPDGSGFKFEKNKNANQEMYQGVPNGSLANTTRFASSNSIPHPTPKSNSSDKKTSENSSGRDFALDIDGETGGISGAEVMGWIEDKTDGDGRSKRSENDSFYADGEEFATPTLSTVGKERMAYSEKAFSRDWLFTKSTSAYIHGVDEMYGIQVYLEKMGKVKNAKAVALKVVNRLKSTIVDYLYFAKIK